MPDDKSVAGEDSPEEHGEQESDDAPHLEISAEVPHPLSVGDIKIRRRNDTFYDDYLHRSGMENIGNEDNVPTVLQHMSYYEYGMYVRIVQGDPWNLKRQQYAFDSHHHKFETHVQELRPAP
eukprot:6024025-Karenia_brevis.AAC.1